MRTPLCLIAILALAPLQVGCGGDDGTTTTPGTDSSSDTKKDDTSTTETTAETAPDSGTPETSGDAPVDVPLDTEKDAKADALKDTPSGGCTSDADCRTFSSYCDGTILKICTCYAFLKAAKDPVCDGKVGTCFVDPCLSKTAWCSAGNCEVK